MTLLYSRIMRWENETAFGQKRYMAHSLGNSSEENEYSWHYVQSLLDWYLILGRSCQLKGIVLIRV